MSEVNQSDFSPSDGGPNQGEQPAAPQDLRHQAERLRALTAEVLMRSEAAELAAWKKAVLLLIILGTVVSVVFLLASGESRREVVSLFGSQMAEMRGLTASEEVFRLPPPPPKTVEPRVEYVGVPVAPASGTGYQEPVLYSQQASAEGGQSAEPASEEAQPIQAPPGKGPEVINAYNQLVEKSPLVQALVNGEHPEYSFQEWQPVKSEPPQFWIDLVCTRQGREVHLIWSIDLENGTVGALSQAARDLQASSR